MTYVSFDGRVVANPGFRSSLASESRYDIAQLCSVKLDLQQSRSSPASGSRCNLRLGGCGSPPSLTVPLFTGVGEPL